MRPQILRINYLREPESYVIVTWLMTRRLGIAGFCERGERNERSNSAEVLSGNCNLPLRQYLYNRLHKGEHHGRGLLQVPSVLHGQGESSFCTRTYRGIQQEIRQHVKVRSNKRMIGGPGFWLGPLLHTAKRQEEESVCGGVMDACAYTARYVVKKASVGGRNGCPQQKLEGGTDRSACGRFGLCRIQQNGQ